MTKQLTNEIIHTYIHTSFRYLALPGIKFAKGPGLSIMNKNIIKKNVAMLDWKL